MSCTLGWRFSIHSYCDPTGLATSLLIWECHSTSGPQRHAGLWDFRILSFTLVLLKHVASRMFIGPSLVSGLMATPSLYNAFSTAVYQNLLSTVKPFHVYFVVTNSETEPLNSGMVSGFGNTRVPKEQRYTHACLCEGFLHRLSLVSSAQLTIGYKSAIGVLCICANSEKVDLSKQTCLAFKKKLLQDLMPQKTYKFVLYPQILGLSNVSSVLLLGDFQASTDTIVQVKALGSRVSLTAIIEILVIEVETEKNGVLDFDNLTYEDWKALPQELNRTHVTVPIRLFINAIDSGNFLQATQSNQRQTSEEKILNKEKKLV